MKKLDDKKGTIRISFTLPRTLYERGVAVSQMRGDFAQMIRNGLQNEITERERQQSTEPTTTAKAS